MLRNIKSWLGSGISADSFPPQVTMQQHLGPRDKPRHDLKRIFRAEESVANGVTNVLTRDFFHPRRAMMQRATGGMSEVWVGGF